MNEDSIRRIVSEEFTKALKEQPAPASCSLGLDKDTHTEEHRYLKSLMVVSKKIDNIKWNIFSDTLKTLWRIFLACAVIGALLWAKVELKN